MLGFPREAMDGFVFTQQYNTPGSDLMRSLGNPILCVADGPARGVTPTHTCDATGSFQGAANRLCLAHGFSRTPFLYDNTLSGERRRESIFTALTSLPDESLDLVAYFGHGTPQGLESAAIHLRDLSRFAGLISRKGKPEASVVLYACSTGAAGGFAEQLARAISKNIWVYAHSGSGIYSNLSMFRRYPGGSHCTHAGGLFSFWRVDRELPQDEAYFARELSGL